MTSVIQNRIARYREIATGLSTAAQAPDLKTGDIADLKAEAYGLGTAFNPKGLNVSDIAPILDILPEELQLPLLSGLSKKMSNMRVAPKQPEWPLRMEIWRRQELNPFSNG